MWKSRLPSWAFRPNEPLGVGFRGRKATLNRASALVTNLSLICQPTSEDMKLCFIIVRLEPPPQSPVPLSHCGPFGLHLPAQPAASLLSLPASRQVAAAASSHAPHPKSYLRWQAPSVGKQLQRNWWLCGHTSSSFRQKASRGRIGTRVSPSAWWCREISPLEATGSGTKWNCSDSPWQVFKTVIFARKQSDDACFIRESRYPNVFFRFQQIFFFFFF